MHLKSAYSLIDFWLKRCYNTSMKIKKVGYDGVEIPVFRSISASDLAFTRLVLASKRTMSVAGAFIRETGSGLMKRTLWDSRASEGNTLWSEVSDRTSK